MFVLIAALSTQAILLFQQNLQQARMTTFCLTCQQTAIRQMTLGPVEKFQRITEPSTLLIRPRLQFYTKAILVLIRPALGLFAVRFSIQKQASGITK